MNIEINFDATNHQTPFKCPFNILYTIDKTNKINKLEPLTYPNYDALKKPIHNDSPNERWISINTIKHKEHPGNSEVNIHARIQKIVTET